MVQNHVFSRIDIINQKIQQSCENMHIYMHTFDKNSWFVFIVHVVL